jgi:hypothetical protein
MMLGLRGREASADIVARQERMSSLLTILTYLEKKLRELLAKRVVGEDE